MSETLTAQQKAAVDARGGKLLVSAAAGSGKTKVLVDRLISYLTDPGNPANLDEFLIITYTKAAAAELRGKISDKLTKYIAEHPENRHMQQQIQRLYLAKISTVHAFCAEILREYAYRLDIPADFRIAEDNECQEMMHLVLEQLLDDAYANKLEDQSFRAFVDTQGLGRDDRQVSDIILQIHASALCHKNPVHWLDSCVNSADVNGIRDAGCTIWGNYLIQELRYFLKLQIQSLENCIQRASEVPGLEKPIALLTATVTDLQSLASCRTWDDISAHKPVFFGTLTFSKEHRNTQLAEQIKAIRNACKEQLPKKLRAFTDPSTTVLSQLDQAALATRGLVSLVKDFQLQYAKIKRTRRVMDFSDIEQRMLDLLLGKSRTGTTSAVEEIASRFREIMVDEYQDSNEVQDTIFNVLTDKRKNLFMVGDVKQSIYQFRLADPSIFLKKYSTFAAIDEETIGENKKVLLNSNFRSSAGVISAVNDVFQHCMSERVGGLAYGQDELLREGIPHITLPDPEVAFYAIDVAEDTYQEEAAFVAQQVQKLLDGSHYIRRNDMLCPITPEDIVILLRSPGSVGAEFCHALELLGIPCAMGNDANLLHTPEIDTLRAILQIIHNPLQDIPLIAALSSPVYGFTADDLATIRSTVYRGNFYNALQQSGLPKAIDFLSQLNQLRSDSRFLTTTQLIHQVFVATGMLSIYGIRKDGEECIHNLQSFCQIAADYEGLGRKDLACFLEYLDTLEDRGVALADAIPAGAVQIMSIHKSKGLEFPVVFLCGLSRTFNTSDLQKQVLCHKELGLGLTCVNTQQRVRFPTIAKRAIAAKITEENLSEELRVLYVAMTRAKDRLILTYAVPKLADRLQDIVLRMDMSAKELMTTQVNCPGNWILQTILRRTEAGELFQLGGYPETIHVTDYPWSIHALNVSLVSTGFQDTDVMPGSVKAEVIDKMQQGLSFRYLHQEAVQIPSKLTATQLKGRLKDFEVAEFSKLPVIGSFRNPFDDPIKSKGTDYGKAMHGVMQYLDFQACNAYSGITDEITRLLTCGLITEDQANLADVDKIYRFFQTEIGKYLRSSREVVREFKFSILENAQSYYSNVSDEVILMQGVVDCAIIEDDGIVLLDFKTDAITPANFQDKLTAYTPQVHTYANALARIYQRPVKASYLYFFCTDQLVTIL